MIDARKIGVTLLLGAGFAACSPSLNWRESRPEGAGLLLMFPCKPELHSRPQERMGLAECKAAGSSFSLSWAELPDVAQLTPTLQQMRESLAAQLKAQGQAPKALQRPGMTPNPAALTQSLSAPGQHAELAVFTRGLKVYQLLMLGPRPDAAAWETFLSSLKLDDEALGR